MGVQKWPDDQKGVYSQLDFFFSKKKNCKKWKIKKLWAIWEVLDTIGQIEKNLELCGGGLQKLKLLCLNWKTLSTLRGKL